jgi:hypothetical protein
MIKFKPFSGDYEKIYDLIKKSWQDDYINKYRQPVQDFSPDFLQWNIQRVGYDPDLILEGYINGDLVGFSANMPKKIIYDGNIVNAVLSTFLSIHPEYKNRGFVKEFIHERIHRMRAKKYDLNYFIQDEGHAIENIVRKTANSLGEGVKTYLRFTFLVKPLDSEKIKKSAALSVMERMTLPVTTTFPFGGGG